MMRRLAQAALVALAALPLAGCMFHIEHRLPVEATFGQARTSEAVRTPFENRRVKRYLLGGTLPWSFSYGSSNKLVDEAPGRRIEDLEIKTRFNPLDMLMRAVPYLGYVLSQRTVYVEGVYVDEPSESGTPPAGSQLEAGELEGR